MKKIITAVVDEGDFLEVHADFAQNIVVGFARLDGRLRCIGVEPDAQLHDYGELEWLGRHLRHVQCHRR